VARSAYDRPIYKTEKTITVDTLNQYGGFANYGTTMFLGAWPVVDLISVTDGEGAAVELDTLRINPEKGRLTFIDGSAFIEPPYTVVVAVGLQGYDNFTSRIEPAVNQAVLDVVSDFYQRRNAAAASEREGGGVSTDYRDQTRGVGADNRREDLLMPRTASLLAPWRMLGV
jgi:hypothetical protein